MQGVATPPLRILVVDDNADTAAILALLLETSGHEVRTAHDGPSALESADDFLPDVVLLDIGMPGMDGLEVARRLRSMPALDRTFIVGSSGYGREQDRRAAADAGVDLYLVKPFDPARLEQVLASRGRRALEAAHV